MVIVFLFVMVYIIFINDAEFNFVFNVKVGLGFNVIFDVSIFFFPLATFSKKCDRQLPTS